MPETRRPPEAGGDLPEAGSGRIRAGGAGAVDDLVVAALARVVGALPGGEDRPGQRAMAAAIARAVAGDEHLVVQAGTGTGKTHAYLVPALLSGRRVVVATATKALQEQLVDRDLPFLHRHLGIPFTAALLKGRSNYLCRSALAEAVAATEGQLLDDGTRALDRDVLAEVVEWSATTVTGDRSDLPTALTDRQWGRLSVGVGECPGASRCSHGDVCFAEDARAAAAAADVVVTNTHLYGLHLASGGAVLPEHELLVVDEAHALEDVAADTMGRTMGPGRFDNLARAFRGLFTADHPAAASLDAAGTRLGTVLEAAVPERGDGRVDPSSGDLAVALTGAGSVVAEAAGAARALDPGGDAATRKERLLQLATHLATDLAAFAELGDGEVAWVERTGPGAGGGAGGGGGVVLRSAPIDVGNLLAERLFTGPTVVLTSATLSVGGSFEPLAARLGLDRSARPWRGVDVGSPFDYGAQALLYCAAHLPDPRAAGHEEAALRELEELVAAAGGRALCLFTSRRAMTVAAARLRDRVPGQLLLQDELPRPQLQARFLEDETSVLLATMGFWQGFDAPGRTCSLVVIDRLPFSRPDDPLAEARRAAATKARQSAFHAVDLPAAAVLLAQGAGRLVRSRSDRGVVAVLDRRLATASYRWTLVRSLPPMRRTKDPAEVRRFLAEVTAPT
ncbi:MAG: ATP-dependent DNA helicase [Acidimicrobiia bacterium]